MTSDTANVDPVRHINRNLLANLLGQGWSALMALLFVPFYLHFLGAAGYGLVGFYATLSALLAIMDGGLGATVTREAVAYPSSNGTERQHLIDMFHTIETLFLAAASVLGVILMLLAPILATHWLHVPAARLDDTRRGLALASIAIALQFVLGFHIGCLVGLQRQVSLNAANAIVSSLRGTGAILLLWLYSPSMTVFFAWQCVVGALALVCFHIMTWRSLGRPPARFRWGSIRGTGRFTASLGIINILGLVLTQLDKVILSRLLSLEYFGYYMIAWSAGTLTLRATGPVFNAYYPRIAELADVPGEKSDLRQTYLQASALLAVMVVPAAMVLAFFGQVLLRAWTGNQLIADLAWLPLAAISLGTMCNAFMHMPYALLLAYRKTSLPLAQNIIAAALLPLLTVALVRHYGLEGASGPWLVLNLGYILFSAPLAFNGLLEKARKPWFVKCVLLPVVLSTLVILPLFALSTHLSTMTGQLALAAAAFLAATVACAWHAGWKQIAPPWLSR
ncbi:oligosaccharide flippase family protein [Rhodanobacter sp. 7MK24]|uniref:lipopolysaccharide biosynthesis protein n=1 Tax=Rhodanobacter sp. 7MK24 TaxID=2775922 RepID=UPI00177B8318|nr:oligosaccharide flippase family protein [Rhodanobacter sp. 7MK24]MBD8880540.1 oligosaccharide flippase family protein [Rhodanobacter sp. 7MK24]